MKEAGFRLSLLFNSAVATTVACRGTAVGARGGCGSSVCLSTGWVRAKHFARNLLANGTRYALGYRVRNLA